jgi:O-methyltransferase
MRERAKELVRSVVPEPMLRARRSVLRRAHDLRSEWPLRSLQFEHLGTLDFRARRALVRRVLAVNAGVPCLHTHAQMARIIAAIFAVPARQEGCVVEAGCFKGGSTAKLSIAAQAAGRKLVVFDSFEGMPEHSEPEQRTIFRHTRARFPKGFYAGQLDEVRENVRRYGELGACEFVKGWFDETMPHFHEPVVVGFLDVDLAASTRTCLRYLYPRLVPGGVLFSHDGHIPLCVDVLRDEAMWESIGGPRPALDGLGTRLLVAIGKPAAQDA